MKKEKTKKCKTVIFRLSENNVKSIDALATIVGVSRSEMLRRCIPDVPNVNHGFAANESRK